MTQEKFWHLKDIIYAKDVLMFFNPATKEIELWVCGKNSFCKIEDINAHCNIVAMPPQNLYFLNRNLEEELYDNKTFENYQEYYTKNDVDLRYLIAKIRQLELSVSMQNFNKETFKQTYDYLKSGRLKRLEPHFFALGKRKTPLSLDKIDKKVHLMTKNMFFDCIACLQYDNKMQKLKYHETQHYMAHIRSWNFFKNRIPRIQNRNRFFTYYELILYKELLNMNYTKNLNTLFTYKRKLEKKLDSNKKAKIEKAKEDQKKQNSKELYKF